MSDGPLLAAGEELAALRRILERQTEQLAALAARVEGAAG